MSSPEPYRSIDMLFRRGSCATGRDSAAPEAMGTASSDDQGVPLRRGAFAGAANILGTLQAQVFQE